ncbi:MAG: hypothetical protein JW727_03365 [Candidatus Aenigmarchaeota archaeon]|nr:hypothetical protein [Candidatus Aenigmarchaeota archaeon]
MDSETKEKISELKEEKWMKVEMTFEVLGMAKDVVKSSLKEHVEKMKQLKTAFVYEAKFSTVDEVENPMKGVEKAYSQIVEMGLMVRDLKTLIALSISFGPSSVEVIEPTKIEVNSGEVQDISNMISGVIHQIAAAGAGGIIATPKSVKSCG